VRLHDGGTGVGLLRLGKRQTASAEREAKRKRKRILNLEAERRRLLQGSTAGAVPRDLLKEGPERITAELANAGAALANTEVHWGDLERKMSMALDLTECFGRAYRECTDQQKRWFHQAVVESIHVDVDGEIKRVGLAEPFRSILDAGLVTRREDEMTKPRPFLAGGSTIVKMVETPGIGGRQWRRASSAYVRTEAPA
jgi:hypothetical protein